jgi:hypothetical protein
MRHQLEEDGHSRPADWQKPPDLLRLHLVDGRNLTLINAQVVGDSLVGHLEVQAGAGTRRHPRYEKALTAVALADIQGLEKGGGSSVLLALVLLLGAALFVAAIVGGADYFEP